MNFDTLQLDDRVSRGVQAAGFEKATPIQAAAIPEALAGHDLIGTAHTGTGKTAAFVLPILHGLLTKEKCSHRKTRALIVTPTRELAEQIHSVVSTLGRFTSVRSATVYGGVGMMHQEKALRQGVEVIVACPGRLLDHINRGNAKLDQVEVLVLDEADRMLDMGFLPSIQQILQRVPPQRQTMLFSATFDSALNQLAAKTLRNPKRVSVGAEKPTATVEHAFYPVPQSLKMGLLVRLLKDLADNHSTVLIFTRTKHRADRIVEKITKSGYPAAALHAGKSQSQRQHALQQFRSGKLKLLVATDIASRGLDISSISHVINFDMPDSPTTYIHRIGRTGRAAATGDAFTLAAPEDHGMMNEIEKVMGKKLEKRHLADFNYHEAARPAADPDRRSARPAGRPYPPRSGRRASTDRRPDRYRHR